MEINSGEWKDKIENLKKQNKCYVHPTLQMLDLEGSCKLSETTENRLTVEQMFEICIVHNSKESITMWTSKRKANKT